MDLQRNRRQAGRRRIQKRGGQTVQNIAGNWRLLLLLLIFTMGMLSGASLVKGEPPEILAQSLQKTEQLFGVRQNQSFLATFWQSLLPTCLLWGITFFSGLCAIGLPIILFIPFWKGISIGMLAGYYYSTFALKGLLYSLLLLYPGAIVATFGLLLCCNEGMKNTTDMFNISLHAQFPESWGGIRLYTFRYLILLGLSIIGAVLDAGLNRLFIRFFTL